MNIIIQCERLTDGSHAWNLVFSDGETGITIPCVDEQRCREAADSIELALSPVTNEKVEIIEGRRS